MNPGSMKVRKGLIPLRRPVITGSRIVMPPDQVSTTRKERDDDHEFRTRT